MRLPDDTILNLNTKEAAELILGLYDYIAELEARTRKRKRRTKKQIAAQSQELGG